MKRLRLEKARIGLQSGQTAKQAAIGVGYPHPRHFSQDFKKHYGRMPSEVALPTGGLTRSQGAENDENWYI